ncbi:hypothetical protein M0419_09995 [Pseudomonas aeruginosa]|uniref:hypothetical protein n=1 Tax=Pseudomonas aeruginosa TaxID=287 RepID=UPI002094AFD5|nr:hypothetical protein [Pseudomonas aeruginosa]USV22550.1 hypothetical protein M0419_09995 [Pseudomonas aeruginosa]
MQRIFLDGHPELERLVPADWARPAKRLNHRSPQRVIALGNVLREPVDGQYQVAREDSEIGIVRLFVLNQDSRLSTGLRTGDLAGLRLFTDRVAPLIAAARMKDDFAVMAQLRATSPLLQRAAIARLAHTDDRRSTAYPGY